MNYMALVIQDYLCTPCTLARLPGVASIGPEEQRLKDGLGTVRSWMDTVDGLHEWERNLVLGDAYLETSAKNELARARFTLGLLALHNMNYQQACDSRKCAKCQIINIPPGQGVVRAGEER